MKGTTIDGNDIELVYNTIHDYAETIRKTPQPILIEAKTFRIRGHEEASGVKYVPNELIEKWKKKEERERKEEKEKKRKRGRKRISEERKKKRKE